MVTLPGTNISDISHPKGSWEDEFPFFSLVGYVSSLPGSKGLKKINSSSNNNNNNSNNNNNNSNNNNNNNNNNNSNNNNNDDDDDDIFRTKPRFSYRTSFLKSLPTRDRKSSWSNRWGKKWRHQLRDFNFLSRTGSCKYLLHHCYHLNWRIWRVKRWRCHFNLEKSNCNTWLCWIILCLSWFFRDVTCFQVLVRWGEGGLGTGKTMLGM